MLSMSKFLSTLPLLRINRNVQADAQSTFIRQVAGIVITPVDSLTPITPL
jgi:hypothetical protein